jgi:hypothetical protein
MSMLAYPQLATGALCQFPLRKSRRTRTVTNRAADGSAIKLADPTAETTEWQLQYSDLSDAEATSLRDFFSCVEGTLAGFVFLDPAGNLLSSSEQLDAQVWQKDPLLTVTAGTGMWRLANGGGAGQVLAQTLEAPGSYQYCLSAYVRSSAASSVGLIIGTQTTQRAVSGTWTRVLAVGTGATDAESMRFGIEVGAGATLEVYGPQVEPQGGASVYKASTRGGVYEDAHLASDELKMICTGVNRHACTVNVIHANHI